MSIQRSGTHLVPALVMMFVLTSIPARAQSTPTDGWKDSAELSWVATGGNTDTSTIGFKNKTWRIWERQATEFNVGGVRAESSSARYAVGTPTDYIIVQPDPELTAESYLINGKYFRQIHERFFWQAGAGWDRDRFAGINNRYTAFGGVGNVWVDQDNMHWRTDYSLSYTDQQDVVDDPAVSDSYLGLRLTSNYDITFGKGGIAKYGNDTIFNFNFDESSDWRMDMTNWVSVTMTSHLGLKISLQWLYDNLPALETIDLLDTAGVVIGTVTVPLDELDSIFNASLVVNF